MMNKRTVLIGVGIVTLVAILLLLTAIPGGSSAQDDPGEQQQTIDAIVQQRFTQTAQVEQLLAQTQIVETQAAAPEPPSPPTQTAAFQATVDAAFNQALQATAQAEMAAAAAARGIELISASNVKRLEILNGISPSATDVTHIAFSPDGTLVATGNQSGAVQLWDPATGAEIRRVAGQHSASITALAFSPDSALLVSVSADGVLYLWNTLTGEPAMNFQDPSLYSATFGADSKTLITGGENGSVKILDVASGKQIQEFTSGLGTIRIVAASPAGDQIAVSGDVSAVELWDIARGGLAYTLPFTPDVTGIAYSPDGQWLAASSRNASPWQWDTRTGVQLWTNQSAPDEDGIAYSADGTLVITISAKKRQLVAWDAATGKKLHTARAGNQPVSVAYSPDGAEFAVAGRNVRMWGVLVKTPEPPTAVETQAPSGPAIPTLTPKPGATPRPAIFPTDTYAQVQIVEEAFEHGRMFWIGINRQIWVMVDNSQAMPGGGDWYCYNDTFQDGEPETDPSLVPPTDLIQPKRGFGKVWRTVPGVRDELGWATTPEFDLLSNYMYIAGGYVQDGQYYPGPGEHRLTTLYGDSISFFEREIRGDCVGGTWQPTADQ